MSLDRSWRSNFKRTKAARCKGAHGGTDADGTRAERKSTEDEPAIWIDERVASRNTTSPP